MLTLLSRLLTHALVPLGLVTLGVLGFITLSSMAEPPAQVSQVERVPEVEVSSVRGVDAEAFFIESNGVVVPRREYQLAAAVEGRVIGKSAVCESGQTVRKGDKLLTIDRELYEIEKQQLLSERRQVDADLKKLAVDIENTQALLKIGEEQLDLQKTEESRANRMRKSKAMSASERDQIRLQVVAAEQAVQMLRNEARTYDSKREGLLAQRSLIDAKLRRVDYNLNRTEIVAPCDGLVMRDHVEVGSYVRPGDTLVEIEDVSTIEVRLNLRMEELYWVLHCGDLLPAATSQDRVNQGLGARMASLAENYKLPPVPAEVCYNLAGTSYTWKGTLARCEGTGFDERTRTAPCRVEIGKPLGTSKNPRFSLRRGMFVEVNIRVPSLPEDLLAVPREALRPGGEVWLVEDGRLQIAQVEPVQFDGGVVIVRTRNPQQVQPGSKVIVSPLVGVTGGIQVKILNPQEAE